MSATHIAEYKVAATDTASDPLQACLDAIIDANLRETLKKAEILGTANDLAGARALYDAL